jgi:hypothetical protein
VDATDNVARSLLRVGIFDFSFCNSLLLPPIVMCGKKMKVRLSSRHRQLSRRVNIWALKQVRGDISRMHRGMGNTRRVNVAIRIREHQSTCITGQFNANIGRALMGDSKSGKRQEKNVCTYVQNPCVCLSVHQGVYVKDISKEEGGLS